MCGKLILPYWNLLGQKMTYGTIQTQVDGLAQVQVLALEYLRTNTNIEYTSAQHKHDMTAHATSLNRRFKSCIN